MPVVKAEFHVTFAQRDNLQLAQGSLRAHIAQLASIKALLARLPVPHVVVVPTAVLVPLAARLCPLILQVALHLPHVQSAPRQGRQALYPRQQKSRQVKLWQPPGQPLPVHRRPRQQ